MAQDIDGGGLHVRCRFRMRPCVELPPPVRELLGADPLLTVCQTDCWDLTSHTGRQDLEIENFPATRVRCELRFDDHPLGAIKHLRWQIDCGIPDIGAVLADFLAEDIRCRSAADFAVSRRLLWDY